MATIKTAISLQESLFQQVENLARDLNVSRSQIVALALEEFLQRHQNRQLLEALNHAYDTPPTPGEPRRVPALRHQHRRLVEGEW